MIYEPNNLSIFWFRQDLRLIDNPGLLAASKAGMVFPIYILDDEKSYEWSNGAVSNLWLHHSLSALNDALGGNLRFFKGNPKAILIDLLKQLKVKKVFWNRMYDKKSITRDTEIKTELISLDHEVKSFNASLLWEPWKIVKEDKTPYKVFTPFYRKGCLNATKPRLPSKAPKLKFPLKDTFCGIKKLNSLNLLEGKAWESKITKHWKIGEKAALEQLSRFIEEGLNGYKDDRNFPTKKNVSCLSPHIHFGEISINKIWYDVEDKFRDKSYQVRDIDHFLSELGWREFSHSLLFYNPDLPMKNLQSRFDSFPWSKNDKFLSAWKTGKTGYPIVDAGMRQLYETGYMHNRLRMIVGSFLVKNLLIDWREGQKWFWECLVDADLANNSAGWQWIAGCGADAAPYFRIFNPVTQALKFDPEGQFIRRFIPEIARLPNNYICIPFDAPTNILADANIVLGKDYPMPIVDLSESRVIALEAFSKTKTNSL